MVFEFSSAELIDGHEKLCQIVYLPRPGTFHPKNHSAVARRLYVQPQDSACGFGPQCNTSNHDWPATGHPERNSRQVGGSGAGRDAVAPPILTLGGNLYPISPSG